MLEIKFILNQFKPYLKFISIAILANLTHLLVFFVVLKFLPTLLPEIANFVSYCSAFSVSFIGHRKFMFSQSPSSTQQSLKRFLLVSVLGFLTLEILFSFSSRILHWPILISLVISIGLSGSQTFLLSRYWAFHNKPSSKVL